MSSPSETMRFFPATVKQIVDVTPSFRRFTFSGEDLADYGDPGFDQRIKVIFPTPTAGIEDMPTTGDWYTTWREMDETARPPIRTYTTRAVRNHLSEVDIDMVVHEVSGPASKWIAQATVGDQLLILAPTTQFTGVNYGIDFIPPQDTKAFLLAGDETAAPAVAAILEQLPPEARGTVVMEFPEAADAPYMPRHPGFDYRVGYRKDDSERHSFLIGAVEEAASSLAPGGVGAEVEEIDIDRDILWEVPRTAKGGAALKSAPLYTWLAGEAGAIKTLRRFLVNDLGVDRRAVAFMGYWRLGKAEG